MASQVELYREANELGIVVAQKLLVMAKPWVKGNTAPDPLFDEDGLVEGSLAGFKTLGGIKKKTGASFTPDIDISDIETYGNASPSRRLIQSEGGKLEIGPQEARRIVQELQTNLQAGAFQATSTGGFRAKKTALTPIRYWTFFVLGEDVNDETLEPIWQWWWFKKLAPESGGKISLAQDAESMPDIELGLFQDGEDLYEFGIDGPGFDPLRVELGYASGDYVVGVGAASAGTFTLSYKGNTTAGIAYNAAASAVKSALVALDDGFDAADWTVTGTAPNWTVTTPDGAPIAGSGSGLTGGTFAVTPVEV
ncbi:hypothetical protein [Gordonia alkanivorans]|uniref:Major tail protein n=2 Tax=root TaxID=1 RepID=F9VYY9_9ACTN|nr:hypothetical protein [Gordonia alkanivorans]YP_009324407.1 major tail protein [Gordonia phage GAL1]AKJ72030.1 putative major tail protein [Gordonia phage GAL1]GAA13828.1 hypothetical protein GOALK_093_00160 [Gordonia alkanivorans NBRC 16433]